MVKSIFSKAMRIARGTALVLGVAVMLALTAGLASTALGANGKPFILGKSNVATKASKLVKDGVGPALDLRVDSGPPLRVNSSAPVPNLNADKVDGLDSGAFQASNAAAGGDLSGAYPSPSLANGVVEPANVGAIPTARVHLGLDQTLPNGEFRIVEFPGEGYDVGNLHDTDVNNSRLTAPVSGVYAISAAVGFSADPDGFREIVLVKNRDEATENGLASFRGPPVTSIGRTTELTLPTQAKLSAGDHVQIMVFQTSGDPLTIRSGPTHFEMTWIAPG